MTHMRCGASHDGHDSAQRRCLGSPRTAAARRVEDSGCQTSCSWRWGKSQTQSQRPGRRGSPGAFKDPSPPGRTWRRRLTAGSLGSFDAPPVRRSLIIIMKPLLGAGECRGGDLFRILPLRFIRFPLDRTPSLTCGWQKNRTSLSWSEAVHRREDASHRKIVPPGHGLRLRIAPS